MVMLKSGATPPLFSDDGEKGRGGTLQQALIERRSGGLHRNDLRAEREFFIDNLLVQIHFIIVMIN